MLFIHPSDELYGADRMLLELIDALPDPAKARVWLPTDLDHGPSPLCVELGRRGVAYRHVDLPILRRAYSSPRALLTLLGRAVRLGRELRRVRPDTVYCTTSAAFIAAPVARLSGVPHVIGHLQEIWTRRDRMVLTPMARCCHRLVAISRAVAEATTPAITRRVTVVPNATPDVEPGPSLAARSGPLTYLVASRWNGWKGHRTLLTAWARLPDPGRLIVLGAAPASGEVVDVRALVKELPDPTTVDVVGEVDDPSSYLAQADVVLVPSDQPEPFGLVAIEAFAQGRPVVGSRGGGLLDIVSDGVDGWFFRAGDAADLARVLTGLDRDQVAVAGAQARAAYESDYTAAAYGRRWRAALGLPAVSSDRRV